MTRRSVWIAIAFAALLVAGTGAVPALPDDGVAAFLARHADGVRLQAWLVMAATVPGALLVGLVTARLGGVPGIAFAVAGATTVALLAAGLLLRLGMARDPSVDLAGMEAYWAPLLTLPILTQALAVVLARDAFPPWVAALSAVLAVEQLAETATIFGSHGFLAPGGEMNTYLGPAVYLVWVLGLGVGLRSGGGTTGARWSAGA